MRRDVLRVFFLLPFTVSFLFAAQGSRDPNALQLGASISRQTGRGQSLRFSVALEKEQTAEVVVDQRGVDVVVRVYSQDRKHLGDFDSENGAFGPEPARIVATVAGTYSVEVMTLGNREAPSGQIEIRLTAIRPATEPELQVARRPEVLKAKGIALLTRLTEMLPELRSLQTRIRYQVQVAQLLWPTDEVAARRIATDAANGVREFLQSELLLDADNEERFYAPFQMRQEVFGMLSSMDPEFALSFLQSTRTPDILASGNPGQPDQELLFEMQLATNIAKKDPKRAFQMAQESLGRGYTAQFSSVISSLRASEPRLASRLMKEAVTKLQEEKLMAAPDAANLALGLLSIARSPSPWNVATSGGTAMQDVPLLSPVDFRNLFSKTLEEALSVEFIPDTYSPESNAARGVLSSMKGMTEDLRNIAPGKAGIIDERLALLNTPGNARDRVFQDAIANSAPDAALEAISRAPLDLRESLYFDLAMKIANTDPVRARQLATTFIVNLQRRQNAFDNIDRRAVNAAINSGRLEDAMAAVRNVKSRRERADLIGQMMYRVSDGSQKAAVALRMLEEARSLLTTSPRVEDQQTMNALLQIAGTLAQFDAPRGFYIVEPFIDQFNDMATAAVELDGFGQQFFQNGELALNNGNSVAQAGNQIGQVLGKLSAVDFERAKNAVDRIHRPEVRAAAYLAIAQQAINQTQVMVRGSRIMISTRD